MLRGLGYWFFYGGDTEGPWLAGLSTPYQTSGLLLMVELRHPDLRDQPRIPAIGRVDGVLEADIGARARLQPVKAGEFVDVEQQRVVEHQASRILVRDIALILDVGPRDDLPDRLDDMRRVLRVLHEGIAIFDAGDSRATEALSYCSLISS